MTQVEDKPARVGNRMSAGGKVAVAFATLSWFAIWAYGAVQVFG